MFCENQKRYENAAFTDDDFSGITLEGYAFVNCSFNGAQMDSLSAYKCPLKNVIFPLFGRPVLNGTAAR